jgi:flavin reductase (DIM6/NTAB) family NADH-FMN oxidoreductase RutF
MHHPISPAILYWGTPVVLITTENDDGTFNIAPMSSAWWLANRCMLGLSASSQTTRNLLRTRSCVLNLPSDNMAENINALARTTGANPVPEWKAGSGYQFVKDKWTCAGLTPQDSEVVRPPRILECPVQMEAEVVGTHGLMDDDAKWKGALLGIEVKILRVHVEDELRLDGHANRIDPDKWSPAIMSFQELYGIKSKKLVASELAKIDEERYRK